MSAATVLLYGCATHPVTLPTAPPREVGEPRGHLTTRPGRPGLVVAAPHGTTDTRTGDIAAEIARRTGFGLVVATGVVEDYEQRVRDTARGALRLYVEIRGAVRPETAGRIEIATVGVDRAHAMQLRTLLELTRDAHLRGHREAPRLDVLVEPADRVGTLNWPERALHIELPRVARHDFREIYAAILADFLADAAGLRPLP